MDKRTKEYKEMMAKQAQDKETSKTSMQAPTSVKICFMFAVRLAQLVVQSYRVAEQIKCSTSFT